MNNIVSIEPVEGGKGIIVTFQCKSDTTRSYWYDPIYALQIMAGADPKNFAALRVE